jgi:hypothetical protein
VPLFRRRKPLHERLAEAGGMSIAGIDPGGFLSQPPGWDGRSPLGEPAFHGIPRPRRWETVASAEAPRLRGDSVHFVALEDRTLIVDEDEPADSLAPLADAVEATIAPPYRAEAVRRSEDTWAVAASRIAIVEEPGLDGEELELTNVGGARTLLVDGRPRLHPARALEHAGAAAGPEYVIRARRVDGDLWEVEATAL